MITFVCCPALWDLYRWLKKFVLNDSLYSLFDTFSQEIAKIACNIVRQWQIHSEQPQHSISQRALWVVEWGWVGRVMGGWFPFRAHICHDFFFFNSLNDWDEKKKKKTLCSNRNSNIRLQISFNYSTCRISLWRSTRRELYWAKAEIPKCKVPSAPSTETFGRWVGINHETFINVFIFFANRSHHPMISFMNPLRQVSGYQTNGDDCKNDTRFVDHKGHLKETRLSFQSNDERAA